jgi:hypothetical protein
LKEDMLLDSSEGQSLGGLPNEDLLQKVLADLGHISRPFDIYSKDIRERLGDVAACEWIVATRQLA